MEVDAKVLQWFLPGSYIVEGSWNWGEQALPRLSKYLLIGVDYTSNGAWDEHVKRVLQNGRKKISQVHT